MKTFKVYMLAFGNRGPSYREVGVPEQELDGTDSNDLNRIYHYGQNEIWTQDCRSVAVGDIIDLGERGYHLVNDFGFVKIGSFAFLALLTSVRGTKVKM